MQTQLNRDQFALQQEQKSIEKQGTQLNEEVAERQKVGGPVRKRQPVEELSFTATISSFYDDTGAGAQPSNNIQRGLRIKNINDSISSVLPGAELYLQRAIVFVDTDTYAQEETTLLYWKNSPAYASINNYLTTHDPGVAPVEFINDFNSNFALQDNFLPFDIKNNLFKRERIGKDYEKTPFMYFYCRSSPLKLRLSFRNPSASIVANLPQEQFESCQYPQFYNRSDCVVNTIYDWEFLNDASFGFELKRKASATCSMKIKPIYCRYWPSYLLYQDYNLPSTNLFNPANTERFTWPFDSSLYYKAWVIFGYMESENLAVNQFTINDRYFLENSIVNSNPYFDATPPINSFNNWPELPLTPPEFNFSFRW